MTDTWKASIIRVDLFEGMKVGVVRILHSGPVCHQG